MKINRSQFKSDLICLTLIDVFKILIGRTLRGAGMDIKLGWSVKDED